MDVALELQRLKKRYEKKIKRAGDKESALSSKDLSIHGYRNLGFYQGLDYAYGDIVCDVEELLSSFENEGK